jgi:hypothetical protein
MKAQDTTYYKAYHSNNLIEEEGLLYKKNKIGKWLNYYNSGNVKSINYYLPDSSNCDFFCKKLVDYLYNNTNNDTIVYSYYSIEPHDSMYYLLESNNPTKEYYEDGKIKRLIIDNLYFEYNYDGTISQIFKIKGGYKNGSFIVYYEDNNCLTGVYSKGQILRKELIPVNSYKYITFLINFN